MAILNAYSPGALKSPRAGLGHNGGPPLEDDARQPRQVSRLARAFYTPREVEAFFGISHATLYRWINDGRLDARKIGSRTGITGESIAALADSLPQVGRKGHP